jgi:hypothetical protein
MFTFCYATMFLFNNGICTMLNSDMLSFMFLFSDLPTQLASELVCLQLVSQVCRGHMFSPMSTQLVLCKARKHLGHIITGKLKRLLWPPDSASSEYGLVRSFDRLSRDVSSQLSKIASAEEMPRATRRLPA